MRTISECGIQHRDHQDTHYLAGVFFLSPEWKVRPRLEPNLPVRLQVKILSRGVEINDKAGPGLNFRRIRTASEDAPSLVYDGIWKRLL